MTPVPGGNVPHRSRHGYEASAVPELIGSIARAGGFTLIELLVVVVIVAILSALLITGYRRAMDLSYQAKASSNLRQIWSATIMFTADHNGCLPATTSSGIGPYMVGTKTNDLARGRIAVALSPYVGDEVFVNPHPRAVAFANSPAGFGVYWKLTAGYSVPHDEGGPQIVYGRQWRDGGYRGTWVKNDKGLWYMYSRPLSSIAKPSQHAVMDAQDNFLKPSQSPPKLRLFCDGHVQFGK